MGAIDPRLPAASAAIDATLGQDYVAQRTRGFRLLRFEPPLEAEYLAQMRDDQRVSALICTATALAIWIAFGAFDLIRLDVAAEYATGRMDVMVASGLRVSTLLVLVGSLVCLFSVRKTRTYPWVSFVALVMIGAAAAVNANVYKTRGMPHAELAEFAIIMAVFLPLGLTFRQSLCAAGMVASTVAIAGLAMLDMSYADDAVWLAAMLAFAAFVGAVGGYLREYAQRDKFLLRRLLHQLAMLDALTGIANRRQFEQHAATALLQAHRDGITVVLAIADVDHFKLFNDRYGHQLGDETLKQVAQRLTEFGRRPLDIVARLGGEEFAMLLYGASRKRLPELLEEIVEGVSDLRLPHDASSTSAHVTISLGAAVFDGRESLESLYRRADHALYEAKDAGRNRMHVDRDNVLDFRRTY